MNRFSITLAICSAVLGLVHGADLRTCATDYVKIGCYDEYSAKNFLLSERSNVRWTQIEAFIKHLACVCAEKARLENRKRSGADKFHAFALHYWGECYGRTKSQLEELKKRSESHRCTGSQDYDGCRVVHDHCVGHGYAEYVYQLREASAEESVNGGYTTWENWTPCTGKCGVGHKLRERTCTRPEPKGKGKDCSRLGSTTETEECDTGIKCPVDGKFSAWLNYGACSKSCGGGKKIRSRKCNNPAPAYGGKDCVGPLTEETACSNDLCPGPDGITKAQDLVRDFLLGFHNTTYPDKSPSGKFHQAIFAIQRSVANEFALGATETSLKDRLADLRKFLKVATAGGSIDFARATLGKELYVFMKKKIQEGLPIDKLNEASNGYLDSIRREIGDTKFGELMMIDGSASLIFTVDTTGSMRDEINAAKGIANAIINMERKFPVDYILSPFNDPSVGPVTHKTETNKAEFVSAIQSLRVSGGGDCHEMAFGGMTGAYEANPQLGSPMFVFTDAGAKDDTFEKKEALKSMADQYGSTINFFTNYQGCRDAKGIKSYQEIAAYTSGQIFPLQSYTEISKFTDYVKNSLRSGTTIAKNRYTSSKKRTAADEGRFLVEEKIETLVITLNVKNRNKAQYVKLYDSNGRSYSAQSTTAYSQVYNIDNPVAGQWRLNFPSSAGERSFIAKAIAKDTVDFVPYFLHQESKDSPVLSVSHPLKGSKSSLVLQVSGTSLVDTSSLKVDITDEDGAVIEKDISLKSTGDTAGIFQAEVNTPSQKFKVLLQGKTKKGNRFQRVSQASFEASEAVLVTVGAGTEFTASASKSSVGIKVYLYNKGAAQTYSFTTQSNHGRLSTRSSSMSMAAAKNSTVAFEFNLPSNARSLVGKTTNIAITARGSRSGQKVQTAFSMLFVP